VSTLMTPKVPTLPVLILFPAVLNEPQTAILVNRLQV